MVGVVKVIVVVVVAIVVVVVVDQSWFRRARQSVSSPSYRSLRVDVPRFFDQSFFCSCPTVGVSPRFVKTSWEADEK
jgi:hypothetical protein